MTLKKYVMLCHNYSKLSDTDKINISAHLNSYLLIHLHFPSPLAHTYYLSLRRKFPSVQLRIFLALTQSDFFPPF